MPFFSGILDFTKDNDCIEVERLIIRDNDVAIQATATWNGINQKLRIDTRAQGNQLPFVFGPIRPIQEGANNGEFYLITIEFVRFDRIINDNLLVEAAVKGTLTVIEGGEIYEFEGNLDEK